MTTYNSRTQISDPSPNNEEKKQFKKDHTVLEKSFDEFGSIQMEDEVKDVLVMIINLVIKSGDAKTIYDTSGKPPSFMSNVTTKLNGNQPIKIVKWNCRSLRSKILIVYSYRVKKYIKK
jgi:hypothetical protein